MAEIAAVRLFLHNNTVRRCNEGSKKVSTTSIYAAHQPRKLYRSRTLLNYSG